MGVLDAARGLLWPAAAPLPARAPAEAGAKALADALVPRERDWTINRDWQDEAGGVPLVGGLSASYDAMYRDQVWVYTVVNILARGIASLPLKVYTRDGENRERDRDSPLARLLARPNDRETPYRLREGIVGDLAVYGNAIVVKAGPRTGPPTSLARLTPRGFAIDRDGDYVWRDPQSGRERAFRRERVIHLHFWRPGQGGMGLSPLEPLRMTLALENAAQRLGIAAFANGARPSGALTTDQDVKPEALTRLREDILRLHGGVDRAFKPAILTNGLKWQAMSHDMQQAAVAEFRRLDRDEVCAAYHVPPPIAGILDRATFANIEVQNRMLAQHTYPPYTRLIEEDLAAQLLPDFGDDEGRYVEHDYAALLRGTPEQQFLAFSQALNAGIFTQNEVRRMLNYPPAAEADADLLHRPLNLSPAPGEPAATDEGGTNAGA